MVTSTTTLEVKTPKGRASYAGSGSESISSLLALIPQLLLPRSEGE